MTGPALRSNAIFNQSNMPFRLQLQQNACHCLLSATLHFALLCIATKLKLSRKQTFWLAKSNSASPKWSRNLTGPFIIRTLILKPVSKSLKSLLCKSRGQLKSHDKCFLRPPGPYPLHNTLGSEGVYRLL